MFFRWQHPFSRRELAELIWLVSHRNILDFLARIPQDRYVVVHYEELLSDPEGHMRQISDFLGVDYTPAMIDPYSEDRMTTGLQPGKQMVGDYKFYLRKKIDPSAATRWKRFHRHDFLSDLARNLARDLGYQDFATEQGVATTTKRQTLTIYPVPRDGDLPLSFSQQRLWFLDHLEPGTPLYNIPAAVRMEGKLDVSALEAAFNDVITRHENLRTTFHTVDGKPQQIIHPDMPINILLEDLCDLPSDMREQEAKRRAHQFAQQSFDLSKGPLLRVALYQIEPEVHLAVIVLHHIVSDGWSNNILVRELALYYDSYLNSHLPQLPPLSIQYADYAAWQRRWLQTADATRQLDYWREQLAGHPTYLALPTDHPRPPVQTYHGAQIRFDLPPDLVDALDELAQEHQATLFMALMAGFQTLLYRYTRQDSINVGIPIANRNHSEVEELIGFFVNTLVLRADFSEAITFAELLRQVQNTAVDAYTNQAAPFELVVDAVQPERDPSYSPLFQVMFAYQEDPPHGIAFSNFKLTPVSLDVGIAKFDMTLSAVKRADQIRAVLEYNTDLFEANTIRRFIRHYQTLLESAIASPDHPVASLSLLSTEERRTLLSGWNDTRRAYERNATIPALFTRQAAALPDVPAVIFEGRVLSYAELNTRSNQLAHALIARGIGPESRVGVFMERSGDVPIAVMGILKAGAAYVPLDPGYPPDRLQYMIKDAGVALVISDQYSVSGNQLEKSPTSNAQRSIWADMTFDVLRLADDALQIYPTTNPDILLAPDNLAYVIYTSGSTGKPKGVACHHRGVINILSEFHHRQPVRSGELGSWWTSLNFDVSVWEIFLPLLFGGTLVVPREEVRIDTPRFLHWMEKQGIESAYLPPFMVQPLLDFIKAGNRLPLRRLLVGVEPIPEEALIAINRRLPDLQIINGYGPTETTICCTLYEVDSELSFHRTTPIGKPYQNVQIYVLDETLQPVPVGVLGEVYIGGDGVSRGYLDKPDLTADRFIPNPWLNELPDAARETAQRLYRTGDLARWLPDGNLMFAGRADFQVKVRGFRIELGEIERVLASHPAVDEAVAMVREDTPGVKRIVAYFTCEDETAPTTGDLRTHLARILPDYMIPSVFVPLDAFPRTPNDKIDRRALPQPVYQRPDQGAAYQAPTNEKESRLAAIWADLLGLPSVGIHDNFFELSGDSILAIQMISRAADEGILITAKQLFQYPTIAGLAAVADEGERIDAEQGIVMGTAPLTPIQHWFFDQAFSHPDYWNQAILLESGQPLNADLMRRAVAALLAHHDALRMRFTQDQDGHWLQENAGFEEASDARTFDNFESIDLASTPDEALGATITDHCFRIQGKLNLADGPLFRAAYFDLGHNRGWRLLLVAHHLVIDGVSWRILTEDLGRAYLSLLAGDAIRLPRKTTAFRDWARALVDAAHAGDFDAEVTFWQKMAASSAPDLPIDLDADLEANLESTLALIQIHLDAATTRTLLSSVESDVQTMLLAALARTLADWTDNDRVLLAMESHGRDIHLPDVDVSRTVGWFTALFPLVLDISGDDMSQLLAQVHTQLQAIPNRGAGYGILRYLRHASGLDALSPQISFNYLGHFDAAGQQGFRPAGEDKGPERHPDARRPYLLDFSASLVDDELRMVWAYSTALHLSATIQRLADTMLGHLQALTSGLSSSVSTAAQELDLEEDVLDDLLDELDF